MRLVCIILAVTAGSLAPSLHAQPRLAGGIEAIVAHSVITSYQVAKSVEPLVGQLQTQYRNQPEALQKRFEEVRQESLELLLENQLILHEFETAGYNLPESIIDDYVERLIRSRYGDRVRLIKTLQEQGMTFEQFRQNLRDEYIVQQMRLLRNQNETIISPHKIEVYYSEHQDQFKVEDQVKLRMIILSREADDGGKVRTLAEEILAKLKEGASFEEMGASLYTQAGRNTGGERDWERTSALKKELADAATRLKPGELSDIIETPEAFYILRVEDKRPEHVRPLNEVRDQIESTLLAQERDRLQKQWIERLKKKTFIRYF